MRDFLGLGLMLCWHFQEQAFGGRAPPMSHCDIESDWTWRANGAWFGVCEVRPKGHPSPLPQK